MSLYRTNCPHCDVKSYSESIHPPEEMKDYCIWCKNCYIRLLPVELVTEETMILDSLGDLGEPKPRTIGSYLIPKEWMDALLEEKK